MRPESIAIRWTLVLATLIGGLAAAITLGQAAVHWWQERNPGPSTVAGGPATQGTVAQGTVTQGSAAADALVRQLFAATSGARLELDAVLVATPGQAGGRATNGLTVFYNCSDGPGEPGADRCNKAELYWASNPLPSQVRDGAGWHLVGTYAVVLDPSKGQVYDATIVVFVLTSIDG